MNLENVIIIEYSPTQRCYHKTTVADMLVKNILNIVHKKDAGYVPIGIANTDEEASDIITTFKIKFALL